MNFHGNSWEDWVSAVLVAVAFFVALQILKRLLASRFDRLSRRRDVYELSASLFRHTRLFFILALSLYLGTLGLSLSAKTFTIVKTAMIFIALVQSAIWGNRAILFWAEKYKRQKIKEDAATVTTVAGIAFVGRMALWIILILIALDNLGVNITALIAGLGIGGIAAALAVQNILKDLFASLSIILDKPFVIGDFIVVGDFMGEIEHVGLKTTRLKSLTGEQLIFSNSDLLQSRIRNYQRMQERRVVLTVGTTFNTPPEQLEKIPGIIREAVESQGHVRFERANFKNLGSTSLDFEAVFSITTPDYNLYMDVQQAINLAVLKRFREEGIAFAYPTQALRIEMPK